MKKNLAPFALALAMLEITGAQAANIAPESFRVATITPETKQQFEACLIRVQNSLFTQERNKLVQFGIPADAFALEQDMKDSQVIDLHFTINDDDIVVIRTQPDLLEAAQRSGHFLRDVATQDIDPAVLVYAFPPSQPIIGLPDEQTLANEIFGVYTDAVVDCGHAYLDGEDLPRRDNKAMIALPPILQFAY